LPYRFSRRTALRALGATLLSAAASALPIASLSTLASASSVAERAVTTNYGGGPLAGDNALPATRTTLALDGLQLLSNDVALPPVEGALARIRLFGDMHFGFTAPVRLAAVARDLAGLAPPDALLSTGDETHFGLPEEYAAAQDWLGQWSLPFYTVTGNHTFWNAAHGQETCPAQYRRFVTAWGLPMPYTWELGGVRFVGAGPTESGTTLAGASLSLSQIEQLGTVLAAAPQQPTVLVLHSPFRHTVLGDSGPPNSVYTSDDDGFFQAHGERLQAVLAGAPQVALVINGHTHSPMDARGLLSLVPVGDNLVPQFNAMALPFVRRAVPKGPAYRQDLVTWELAILSDSLVLTGRDHLARRDAARTVIPLPATLPSLTSAALRL
jgi:predicted MPP superfamily phosphohydrolase